MCICDVIEENQLDLVQMVLSVDVRSFNVESKVSVNLLTSSS